MNEEEIKAYLKNQTTFDLSDIFDPLIEKRIVWKKRRYTDKKGRLELMEICGEKSRVAATIFYEFYSDKRPKILVIKDGKVFLYLKTIKCLNTVVRGLENLSLGQLPDFRRKNLRVAVRVLIKENVK